MNPDFGNDNYSKREAWVKKTLGAIPSNETILDAGAGPMNYRPLCGHLAYKSQDLNKVYGNMAIDIVSDIVSIPVPNDSFDNVLCTEVLEHLPDPVAALRELTRIIKPSGRLILTAPFACLKHEEPYFYNAGFDKRWFEYQIPKLGFTLINIEESGNYYGLIAQELLRISSTHPDTLDSVTKLVAELSTFSDKGIENMACYGVHVLAQKDSDLKNRFIKDGMFVFDVGANRGNKAQQYLDTGCRVVCIEPNPTLAKALTERFGQRVPVENFAMGAAEGKLPLHICRASNGDPIFEISSMSKDFREETHKHRFSCFSYRDNDFITVPVTTLDSLIEKYGMPDYVKIDVEGFEMEVLKGLSYPVKMVSIEFTPELCEKTVDCIKRFLEINPGYKFNYSSRETNRLTFGADVVAEEMIAFLRKIDDMMVEYGDVYAVLG